METSASVTNIRRQVSTLKMYKSRILILTASHLCRNPRVVKEATTLGLAGYDVTVLTVAVQPRFEAFDRELVADLPFRRVVLDYCSDYWSSRLSDFSQRSATWIARYLCRACNIESAQSLGPAWALLRAASSISADLTIVHTEIPIWASQHLIRSGRKVAVDVEDWYSEDLLYADRQSRPIRLLKSAEAFALNNCTYSSTTSGSMSAALAERYNCRPPIILRNTFPYQPCSRIELGNKREQPAFIWFSQTIGPGRGLELFFAAWARTTHPSEVYLLGDERPGYGDKLRDRLPPSHRNRVHFLQLVPPNDLPLLLANFDIGLALEPNWPRNRNLTISNKIFQYMNAGLAIIMSDTAGQREIYEAAPDIGRLVTAHETGEYARILDSLISQPQVLKSLQLAARKAATRYCWEEDAMTLTRSVERALD